MAFINAAAFNLNIKNNKTVESIYIYRINKELQQRKDLEKNLLKKNTLEL